MGIADKYLESISNNKDVKRVIGELLLEEFKKDKKYPVHKNRTLSGVRKEEEIRDTYRRWWEGKTIKIANYKEPIHAYRVNYHGNSVYGAVLIHDENGQEYNVFTDGFRPRKKDVEILISS